MRERKSWGESEMMWEVSERGKWDKGGRRGMGREEEKWR